MCYNEFVFYFALEEDLLQSITFSDKPFWEELTSAVKKCGDKTLEATLERQVYFVDEGIYIYIYIYRQKMEHT